MNSWPVIHLASLRNLGRHRRVQSGTRRLTSPLSSRYRTCCQWGWCQKFWPKCLLSRSGRRRTPNLWRMGGIYWYRHHRWTSWQQRMSRGRSTASWGWQSGRWLTYCSTCRTGIHKRPNLLGKEVGSPLRLCKSYRNKQSILWHICWHKQPERQGRVWPRVQS